MNRPNQPPHDLDQDPVWALLEQSPAPRASGHFVDDVMRAVRIAETAPLPWWRRVFSPVTWGSVSAAAAAVALAVLAWGPNRPSTGTSRFAGEDSLSDLQDFAEEEMLVAAADHLSDYSDDELVTLLGF